MRSSYWSVQCQPIQFYDIAKGNRGKKSTKVGAKEKSVCCMFGIQLCNIALYIMCNKAKIEYMVFPNNMRYARASRGILWIRWNFLSNSKLLALCWCWYIKKNWMNKIRMNFNIPFELLQLSLCIDYIYLYHTLWSLLWCWTIPIWLYHILTFA